MHWYFVARILGGTGCPLLDCYNYKSIHDHFFFFFFNNYDRIIINNIHFMMIIFYHHDFINFQFDEYNLNKKNYLIFRDQLFHLLHKWNPPFL